jgi:ferredoxin-NADP reductase
MKKAKLTKKLDFTEDVFELQFQTEEEFEFEAGQFVTFKIDDATPPCFRAYSISACPTKNGNIFETCVKLVENGRGSNWLNNLKEGDEVGFIGPSGKFIYQENKKNSFFIATGTGVTPFKSMIQNQLESGNKGDIKLLFGLRHISGVFYKDFFQDLSDNHDNFNYKITLSRPENEDWDGEKGRVTDYLRNLDLDNEDSNYYICGLKAMIDEVLSILTEKGVPEENIHFEKFD